MARVLSDQPERENAFGHSCVRLRKSMGLTQRALGRLLSLPDTFVRAGSKTSLTTLKAPVLET